MSGGKDMLETTESSLWFCGIRGIWVSVAECYGGEKGIPTLFLDSEPSVNQRIGLENELMISWRWER